MPITIKEHKNPAINFEDLECGECFLYSNTLYFKAHVIPENDPPYDCAVNLETGDEDVDLYGLKVVPVNVELTYSIK